MAQLGVPERSGRGTTRDGLTSAEKEELGQLRREKRRLKLERETLAKAAAWFARETGSVPGRSAQPVRTAEVPTSPPRKPPSQAPIRKLRVGVIDLVTKGPTRALYARVMNANLASIMPQVVAAWCEAEGHEVTFVCYTGLENLVDELPRTSNSSSSARLQRLRSSPTRSPTCSDRREPLPSWVVLTPAAIRRMPGSTSTMSSVSRTGPWSATCCGIARLIGRRACTWRRRGSPPSSPACGNAGSSSNRRWKRRLSSRSCR